MIENTTITLSSSLNLPLTPSLFIYHSLLLSFFIYHLFLLSLSTTHSSTQTHTFWDFTPKYQIYSLGLQTVSHFTKYTQISNLQFGVADCFSLYKIHPNIKSTVWGCRLFLTLQNTPKYQIYSLGLQTVSHFTKYTQISNLQFGVADCFSLYKIHPNIKSTVWGCRLFLTLQNTNQFTWANQIMKSFMTLEH